MKITNEAVESLYSLAVQVHRGELSRQQALEKVQAEGFLNPGSARNFLTNFQNLMEGTTYKRAMNLYATEYFLRSILRDFGASQFQTS